MAKLPKLFTLADCEVGKTYTLAYFEGSTPHSLNSGQFDFTPEAFTPATLHFSSTPAAIRLPGMLTEDVHYTVVNGSSLYKGENKVYEGDRIYTAPHVAAQDSNARRKFPADTLYRGSGCEPLFIL